MQPIRRFGFDAAILFSDILTVPEALGQKVTFTEGEGPSLEPVTSAQGFDEDREQWARYFEPVYEALRLTRAGLPHGTALLGFAGAPWTLATYLAAGAGGDEQKAAKLWAYRDPQGFGYLLDILGGVRRLPPDPPAGCRRRCGADLRQLGQRPAGSAVRARW